MSFNKNMIDNHRMFPDWETLYMTQNVESMPWYSEQLDPDLELELNKRNIHNGTFLDLGTGPGTQAIKLSEKGFHVIGSDISPTSIKKANVRYNTATKHNIKFVIDDILCSELDDSTFDYVFDRGCFHVIMPEKRAKYIEELRRILKKGGLLFLKCFSEKEPLRNSGPYRFSPKTLKEAFHSKEFKIISIEETVYQGTLNPLPKALFAVITI